MKKFLTLLLVTIIVVSCGALLPACHKNEENDLPHQENTPSLPEEEVEIIPPLPPSTEPDIPSEKEDVEVENPPVPTKEYAYYLSATVDSLNVRARANTSAKRLGVINKGDMVSLEGELGEWYRTLYKEQTAYVHKDYVKVVKIEKSNDKIEEVIKVGLALLGHPYVYGSERYHWGNGLLNYNFVPGKYDCSALMQYMFYKGNGNLLEVTSKKQYYQGSAVDELKRGDLMFFTNANGYNATGINRVRHVGLYLGDNYILHTASDYAVIEPISQTRWSYFITAKRII
ncbi:MAG: C40 family peptidase [Clostridia bacterium]|nr:C40 family peptidase [Clostridia bacterium]